MWEFLVGLSMGTIFGFLIYALVNSDELDKLDRPSDTRKK
jgi:hypothetical protein